MLKNFKKKNNNKGFTLVELLVVIAIIGILAVVAVPSLFKNMDKAKAVQVVSNVNAVKTEIMSAYANGDNYDSVVTNSESIVDVVTDNKEGHKYSVVAKTDANGTIGVRIKVEVGEGKGASEVLLNAAKQLSASDEAGTAIESTDEDPISNFYVDVTN